ncbi:MAG: hypothetical protein L0Z62_21120 [Gemmataceae bacterium]|nr:hypothetical protein [Gemmataceae bacterium]
MQGARIRLGIAATLFVAWIGYLLYLTTTLTPAALVLSRPQFLVSSLDVIARVEGDAGRPVRVTITEVHWPHTPAAAKLREQQIPVTNLADCEGWEGDGLYILPLVSAGQSQYQVVATPASPGYDPRFGRPHIYPLTHETRQQLDSIRKPETVPLPPLEDRAEVTSPGAP